MINCADCQAEITRLELFPKGRCVECHAKAPENRAMPTAEELRQMWGGK